MAYTVSGRIAALMATLGVVLFFHVGLACCEAPNAGADGLHYAWKPNVPYRVRFKIEIGEVGQRKTLEGLTVYTPSTAQARVSSGEESGEGTGTGFVVKADGYLVTCAHVVRGSTKISVHLGDKDYPATVTTYEPHKDLALLHVAAAKLTVLPLGDSDKVELGQDIRALGFPLADMLGESIKITRGSVCGIMNRDDNNLFQVDASINPVTPSSPALPQAGPARLPQTPQHASPTASADAGKPRDPVRKISDPPPPPPKRHLFGDDGPRTGLDQFRPDE